MTDAEAMRLLRRAGWSVARRGKGSHLIMQRKEERRVFPIGRVGKHKLSRTARAAVLRATRERTS